MTESEHHFQEQLAAAIQYAAEDPDGSGLDCLVESFADNGVMTLNAGLVVALQDGSEYQLTIVQSKPAGSPPREEFAVEDLGHMSWCADRTHPMPDACPQADGSYLA